MMMSVYGWLGLEEVGREGPRPRKCACRRGCTRGAWRACAWGVRGVWGVRVGVQRVHRKPTF